MATTYLDYVDEKSSKFWEITINGSEFTVRYGKIGTDGRLNTKSFTSEEEAQKEADKLIKSKTKKGYAAPSGGAAIDNPEPIQMSWDEARAKYASLGNPQPQTFGSIVGSAVVYLGSVTYDGYGIKDLHPDHPDEGSLIIVDGDLTFTNDTVSWNHGSEAECHVLLVTGNVTANGMNLSEVGSIDIEGNLTAKIIAGSYGDNGGSLSVVGHTKAEFIVATTYFMFSFKGGVIADYIIGDSTYATDWTDDFMEIYENLERFDEDLIDGEALYVSDLVDRVVNGQPIFVD